MLCSSWHAVWHVFCHFSCLHWHTCTMTPHKRDDETPMRLMYCTVTPYLWPCRITITVVVYSSGRTVVCATCSACPWSTAASAAALVVRTPAAALLLVSEGRRSRSSSRLLRLSRWSRLDPPHKQLSNRHSHPNGLNILLLLLVHCCALPAAPTLTLRFEVVLAICSTF
jgi:hypothetical protein